MLLIDVRSTIKIKCVPPEGGIVEAVSCSLQAGSHNSCFVYPIHSVKKSRLGFELIEKNEEVNVLEFFRKSSTRRA